MAKLYGLMRLGRDAEIKRMQDGEAVCNLSLAYDYGKKDGNGDRPTQWVDAALWGKRAESVAEYLVKGSKHLFTIDGVHMEKYIDKEGFEAFTLKGTVSDVELGDRKDSAPQRQPAQQSSQAPQRRAPAPAPAPRQQQRQAPPRNNDDGYGGPPDEDIPY